MKVTRITPVVVPEYTITLSERELLIIAALLGASNSGSDAEPLWHIVYEALGGHPDFPWDPYTEIAHQVRSR